MKIGLKDLEVKGKQRTAKGQLQYTLAGPSPFADKIRINGFYLIKGGRRIVGMIRGLKGVKKG